jgi:hypothetical protein
MDRSEVVELVSTAEAERYHVIDLERVEPATGLAVDPASSIGDQDLRAELAIVRRVSAWAGIFGRHRVASVAPGPTPNSSTPTPYASHDVGSSSG